MTPMMIVTSILGCVIGYIINCGLHDDFKYLWGFTVGTFLQVILQIFR